LCKSITLSDVSSGVIINLDKNNYGVYFSSGLSIAHNSKICENFGFTNQQFLYYLLTFFPGGSAHNILLTSYFMPGKTSSGKGVYKERLVWEELYCFNDIRKNTLVRIVENFFFVTDFEFV
jgi:hypothetical protein